MKVFCTAEPNVPVVKGVSKDFSKLSLSQRAGASSITAVCTALSSRMLLDGVVDACGCLRIDPNNVGKEKVSMALGDGVGRYGTAPGVHAEGSDSAGPSEAAEEDDSNGPEKAQMVSMHKGLTCPMRLRNVLSAACSIC